MVWNKEWNVLDIGCGGGANLTQLMHRCPQGKVSVSVKYLDQRTKATQISQFDLTLEKDSNWKIVK